MQFGSETVLADVRAAAAHGEVAQGRMAGIEMAMQHQIAGRKDRARLDPKRVRSPPSRQTIAKPVPWVTKRMRRDHGGETGPAPRRQIPKRGNLGRAGKAEAHDLHALASHWIIVERKLVDVGNYIGLP